MKTTALLSVLSAALVTATDAATPATHIRIAVRGHGHHNHMNGKLTFLNIGQQCAYDPAMDPSLYPCRDGGVCVRTNATYGECFSKEKAAEVEAKQTAEEGSEGSDESDESEDDESQDQDEAVAASGSRASNSTSGSSAREETDVGDDDENEGEGDEEQGDDEDDEDGEEEQEHDDGFFPTPLPKM